MKNNPRIFLSLKRVQARIKGLIVRKNIRSVPTHKKFMTGNESYTKYMTVSNSKIVSLYLYIIIYILIYYKYKYKNK